MYFMLFINHDGTVHCRFKKKKKIDGLWIFLCNACCLYTCMKQTKVFYCLSDFWKYIKPTRVLVIYLPKWNGYNKADVTDTN